MFAWLPLQMLGAQGAITTPPAPTTKVFVGNIPYSASWQDLKDIFRNAGNVLHANILLNREGRPMGSAVVEFETR
jgi:RNA recognition motif-containing protein